MPEMHTGEPFVSRLLTAAHRTHKQDQEHPRELRVRYATGMPGAKGASVFLVRVVVDLSWERRCISFYDQRGELQTVQWGTGDSVLLTTVPEAVEVDGEVVPG